MADRSVPTAVLPVGFERFHRRAFVNYQLNRAYSLGFADRDELSGAASYVRAPQDCVSAFEDLSRRAAAEGRARQATSYLRLAEFFTPPRTTAKVERYRRYRDLFDVGLPATAWFATTFRTRAPCCPPTSFRLWERAREERCSCTADSIH